MGDDITPPGLPWEEFCNPDAYMRVIVTTTVLLLVCPNIAKPCNNLKESIQEAGREEILFQGVNKFKFVVSTWPWK